MPAAAVYLRDPDGYLLEYLAMLDDPPKPERGITTWSEWRANLEVSQRSDNAPAIAV
jgi:hypothetical protein